MSRLSEIVARLKPYTESGEPYRVHPEELRAFVAAAEALETIHDLAARELADPPGHEGPLLIKICTVADVALEGK